MADEFDNMRPPAPLYVNDLEQDFAKEIADEMIEQVIGQGVVYYPLDIQATEYHPVYGEAIEKVFMRPIRVHCLVTLESITNGNSSVFTADTQRTITVHFNQVRLTEDQNLLVRLGDYVKFGDRYYEIAELIESRFLWGDPFQRFEVSAKCHTVRKGHVIDVE